MSSKKRKKRFTQIICKLCKKVFYISKLIEIEPDMCGNCYEKINNCYKH